MLFSVLIANYNNSRYIEEALSSVFAQTSENWEIIIVDDASTDNSLQIIQKYKEDSRVHIYQNDENKGCGFTKRKCIEKANGEICGFLDSDDAISSKAIEIMIKYHKKYFEKGLIYSSYYRCNKNLEPEYIPSWIGEFKKGETQLLSSRISHFATFKKRIYEQTSGINSSLKRAVDQDLYLKLEEVTETKYIDQPLYYYREHEKGISTNNNKNRAKYWSLIVAFDACERRGIDKEDFFSTYLKKHNKNISVVNSKEYKLGKLLLSPIRKFYQLFK